MRKNLNDLPGMNATVHRRHGFAGQHMVVLPGPLQTVARRHPLLEGLLVTEAGYSPHASGHVVERPQGVPMELLIVCLFAPGSTGEFPKGEDCPYSENQ